MLDIASPTVTVLMPVFNGQEHLSEAIESILAQTLSSFELLIVNDGSTDGTAAILAYYAAKDDRVYVVSQPNAGIVAALNVGLSLARGTYIARMDADDIAHPRRLEVQLAYMAAHPNCVICGSDYKLIGARKGRVKTPRSNKQCKARLLIESCFAHPTVMLRAEVLKLNNLFYEKEFEYVEDYRLWTLLASYGDFANLPKALMYYRVHSGQTSSQKKSKQRERHSVITVNYLRSNGSFMDEFRIRRILWGEGDSGLFMSVCQSVVDAQNIFNNRTCTLNLKLQVYMRIVMSAMRRFLRAD